MVTVTVISFGVKKPEERIFRIASSHQPFLKKAALKYCHYPLKKTVLKVQHKWPCCCLFPFFAFPSRFFRYFFAPFCMSCLFVFAIFFFFVCVSAAEKDGEFLVPLSEDRLLALRQSVKIHRDSLDNNFLVSVIFDVFFCCRLCCFLLPCVPALLAIRDFLLDVELLVLFLRCLVVMNSRYAEIRALHISPSPRA